MYICKLAVNETALLYKRPMHAAGIAPCKRRGTKGDCAQNEECENTAMAVRTQGYIVKVALKNKTVYERK